MIYVTGDIHSDPFSRLSSEEAPFLKNLTKDDYVVILGDFGCVWDCRGENKQEKYTLDWLESKPFTTLFIDGNHENFDRLNGYAAVEWCGGLVHKIRPHVIHLMRGFVYTIDGKTIFAFGGARSHDIRDGILSIRDKDKIHQWRKENKSFRIDRVSWWKEEMPDSIEMVRGMRELERHHWKVNYVFTHCQPSSITTLIGGGLYDTDECTDYLEKIKNHLEYDRWYSGHMHINKNVTLKDRILYEDIDLLY